MANITDELKTPLSGLLLATADDKFVLGHRIADWTGLAPILEEDIAFSAIAQEEIAHAAALYELVADLVGGTADAVAYGRAPTAYRCATLVERPDQFDWGFAIVRQFLCDRFDLLRLERMSRSSYAPLAALAARLRAEERVHVEHSDGWVDRLGRGDEESRTRLQAALDALAPEAPMLFEPVPDQDQLESAGLYPPLKRDMFDQWVSDLTATTRAAGLNLALSAPPANAAGGRRGRHGPDFVPLLDEVCEVYRTDPEAAW